MNSLWGAESYMHAASKAIVVAWLAWVGTYAYAADLGPLVSPAYRLSSEGVDRFRLVAAGGHAPPATPVASESTIPPALAIMPFSAQILAAARQADVDPALVHALIQVESRYNHLARSSKGAIGLMQVMPGTARRYGVTKAVHSVELNLRAGTLYLSDLLTLFDNRIDLALAAYNAGENAVIRYGMRIPPFPETRAYVPAVLSRYHELKKVPPPPPEPTGFTYLRGTRLDPEAVRYSGR